MAAPSLCSPKPSNFSLSTIIKSPNHHYLPNQSYKSGCSSHVMHRLLVLKPVQLSGSGFEPNHDHKVVSSDDSRHVPKLQPCKTPKGKRGMWRSMILMAVPLYEKFTNEDDVTKILKDVLEAIEAFARMIEKLSLEAEKLPNGTFKCEASQMKHMSQELITFVELAEKFISKVDEILMVWKKT